MATTLAKLTRDIQRIAANGPISDDFRISDRQVEFWIAELRAKLISQTISKNKDINDVWIQRIKCLELEQVDKAECCDIQTDCLILRSIRQIPNTIESNDANFIISVMGLDGSHITPTTRFRQRYKRYSRFTGNNKGWFLKDRYIYVINDDLLTYVNVDGIFDDPRDLIEFSSCEGIPCFSYESDYPVSLKMATDITDIILQTKIRPMFSVPQDTTNDSANQNTIQK